MLLTLEKICGAVRSNWQRSNGIWEFHGHARTTENIQLLSQVELQGKTNAAVSDFRY